MKADISDELLREVQSYIDGFKGYRDKSSRRASDEKIRAYIIERMNLIESIVRSLLGASLLVTADKTLLLNVICSRAQKIREVVTTKDESIDAFYEKDQIDEGALLELTMKDLKCVKIASRLVDEVRRLSVVGLGSFDARNRLLMLSEAFKVLYDQLLLRKELIIALSKP